MHERELSRPEEREMLALGCVLRREVHPMWVVGVLVAMYRSDSNGVDRQALAYVLALLFELYSSSGSDC